MQVFTELSIRQYKMYKMYKMYDKNKMYKMCANTTHCIWTWC